MLEFPGTVFRPAIYEVAVVSDKFGWMVVMGYDPLFGGSFRKRLVGAKEGGEGPGPEDDGIARHILSSDLEVEMGCRVDALVALSKASNPLAPRNQLSWLDMDVLEMGVQGENHLPIGEPVLDEEHVSPAEAVLGEHNTSLRHRINGLAEIRISPTSAVPVLPRVEVRL